MQRNVTCAWDHTASAGAAEVIMTMARNVSSYVLQLRTILPCPGACTWCASESTAFLTVFGVALASRFTLPWTYSRCAGEDVRAACWKS